MFEKSNIYKINNELVIINYLLVKSNIVHEFFQETFVVSFYYIMNMDFMAFYDYCKVFFYEFRKPCRFAVIVFFRFYYFF